MFRFSRPYPRRNLIYDHPSPLMYHKRFTIIHRHLLGRRFRLISEKFSMSKKHDNDAVDSEFLTQGISDRTGKTRPKPTQP